MYQRTETFSHWVLVLIKERPKFPSWLCFQCPNVCVDRQNYRFVHSNTFSNDTVIFCSFVLVHMGISPFALIASQTIGKAVRIYGEPLAHDPLLTLQTSCTIFNALLWGTSISVSLFPRTTNPSPPVFRRTNWPESLRLLCRTLSFGCDIKPPNAALKKPLEAIWVK